MNLGKSVRLNRLFAHPSGRLASAAVDHFINYSSGNIPEGLRDIGQLLQLLVEGKPDSITMHRGLASSIWPRFAGKIPFILQSTLAGPNEVSMEQIADPEDAMRLGADAFAVAGFVRGPTEIKYLKIISQCVKEAAPFEMPVIVHIYPRRYDEGLASISYEPEDIAWAVRCSLECGVDVIKVPYCGDVAAYAQIVSECPVPIVAAGGPKSASFKECLRLFQSVVASGAKGAVVGRNVWSHNNVLGALRAVKSVIHDQIEPGEAMVLAGLAKHGSETAKSPAGVAVPFTSGV